MAKRLRSSTVDITTRIANMHKEFGTGPGTYGKLGTERRKGAPDYPFGRYIRGKKRQAGQRPNKKRVGTYL